MLQNLITDIVTKDFNPKKDVPLGPWCFQNAEDVYPDWDRLDFINPFADASAMNEASYQTISLYENFVSGLAQEMNTLHNVNLSDFSWRHLLLGWYVMLTQVSYVRFRHIEHFIAQHKDTNFHVKLAPRDIAWNLETSHNLSQLTSRSDFDHWLSSLIIRELAPKGWVLEEELDFKIQDPKPATLPVMPAAPSSLRETIRDKVLSWVDQGRFGRIYGTTWRSQLFFLLFLNLLPARKKKNEPHLPIIEGLNPHAYFPKHYLEILDFLAKRTMPRCFADKENFKLHIRKAEQNSYSAGKIRVITPDVFKEDLKFKTVLAYEAGEKILATQHGSWYGTVSSATISHMAEYVHYAFLSWGWNQHIYKGHYVPLPSPLLYHFKKQRQESIKLGKGSSLLFVENIVNLRSTRLSGQPMPADIVKRRYHKKEFLAYLRPEIFTDTLYRPHIHHDAGIDENSFLCRHFKDLKILKEPSMDSALIGCKLYVSNHYGTTLHVALAADIPTVCYWDSDYPQMSPIAQPYFEKLKEHKILFDNPQDAVQHINAVWDDIDGWWNNPALQQTKQDWCYRYARTNPLWVCEWMKAFIQLN